MEEIVTDTVNYNNSSLKSIVFIVNCNVLGEMPSIFKKLEVLLVQCLNGWRYIYEVVDTF